mmetsp:Transcript_8070/g.20633  ORF Transcript_8070/g.20633 Transcript_8070/m.20633 type:complete len:469 (+) Transcript_8070:385-1791(+)
MRSTSGACESSITASGRSWWSASSTSSGTATMLLLATSPPSCSNSSSTRSRAASSIRVGGVLAVGGRHAHATACPTPIINPRSSCFSHFSGITASPCALSRPFAARDRTKIALRYLLEQHPWDAFAKKLLSVLLEAQGRVTGDPPQLATQYNAVHRLGGGHVQLPQPQPVVQSKASAGAIAAMSKQWQPPPTFHGGEPATVKGSQGDAPSVGVRGLAGSLGKRRAAEQATLGGDSEGGLDHSGGGSYDCGNQGQSSGGGASEAGNAGGDTARVTNELKQRSQRLEAHGVDPLQEILAAAAPRRNSTLTQRGGRQRSASHYNAPTKSMCDPRDPAKTHREVFDSQPEDPTGNIAGGTPVASTGVTGGQVESEGKLIRQGGPVALPEHSPAPIVQANFKEKGIATGAKRQKKTKWSDAEVQALETGVGTYGEGSWAEIHKNVPIFRMNSRTQVDMKDKWRNIKKKRDQDA